MSAELKDEKKFSSELSVQCKINSASRRKTQKIVNRFKNTCKNHTTTKTNYSREWEDYTDNETNQNNNNLSYATDPLEPNDTTSDWGFSIMPPKPLCLPKFPWKSFLLVFFLVASGLFLSFRGITTFFASQRSLWDSTILVLLGTLCTFTGAYHGYEFVLIFRGLKSCNSIEDKFYI